MTFLSPMQRKFVNIISVGHGKIEQAIEFTKPWGGDPRVNIQRGENGKAKACQVVQIIRAVDKAEQLRTSPKVNEDAK
jgi:hypothetical protein